MFNPKYACVLCSDFYKLWLNMHNEFLTEGDNMYDAINNYVNYTWNTQ